MADDSSYNSDTNSRRAFPLDSRAVWVEQHLHQGLFLPKENLVLGPGEYTPSLQERHVSSPSLGHKSRSPVGHFLPYHSKLGIRTPGSGTPKATANLRFENTTIFHEHGSRLAIDPSRRFVNTPGAYRNHDPILRAVTSSGVTKARNVTFGTEIRSTDESKLSSAGPDYDVNYDSNVIRPKTQYVKFHKPKTKSRREGTRKDAVNFDGNYSRPGSPAGGLGSSAATGVGLRSLRRPIQSPSTSSRSPLRSTRTSGTRTGTGTSTTGTGMRSSSATGGDRPRSRGFLAAGSGYNSMRASMVPLPNLKHRKFETLVFNASSYQSKRLKAPLDITPNLVNSQLKIDPFRTLVCIPRKHESKNFYSGASSASSMAGSQQYPYR